MSKTENLNREDLLDLQTKGHLDDKIKEYYTHLHSNISELDLSVNEIVHRHEKDFLSAFRVLMGQVQQELQKLRDMSDEQALMVKRDQAVQGLQDSLNWFQKEAVKLSEACSDLQSKYDENRLKIHTLTIENAHLEEQVKLLLRQNQTLKEQLQTEVKPTLFTPEKTKPPPTVQGGSDLPAIAAKYNIDDSGFLKELKSYQENSQKLMNDTVKHYKNIIAAQKNKIKAITSDNSTAYLQRSQLEEIFFNCVEEAKKEAGRRKETANPRLNLPRENLNSADKRKLLERFIGREEVVSIVYDHLFPSSKDHPTQGTQFPQRFKIFRKDGLPTPSYSSKGSRGKSAAVVNGKLVFDK